MATIKHDMTEHDPLSESQQVCFIFIYINYFEEYLFLIRLVIIK
jgi:hypothetical protein